MDSEDALYNITKVIINGDWGSIVTPEIAENPTFIEQDYELFRRIIYIIPFSQHRDDKGFQRRYEGRESEEIYQFKIKAAEWSDLKLITQKLREIIIDEGKTHNYYNSCYIPDTTVYPDKLKNEAEIIARCSTTGDVVY